jgi:predicted AAA+ superfamily ATPase
MIDKFHTTSYSGVLQRLQSRLKEPVPGRIQLLSGPRQVGKTHLLLKLKRDLGSRVVYAAADAPTAAISGWWEAQWRAAETIAAEGRQAVLIIDEIQYLSDWSRRLKAEYDRVLREGLSIHVVVTGSSSLSLGKGARETMAGRFEHLKLLHWPAAELVRQLGTDRDHAVTLAVTRGTYPGAVPFLADTNRWQAYVRESIVEPAIGRDILALETVRKPALLRQVFAIAAAHPCEIVSLLKLRARLEDRGALETIAHYLHLLEQAYLVTGLQKYSERKLRQRAAPPKLVVLNQGIIAALAAEPPASSDSGPLVPGFWVENACAALAWNSLQEVTYWREEPLEVNFVTSGSWGRWAIEVKTGSFSGRDLAGLLEFCRRNRSFRPLVLCNPGDEPIADAAGLAALSWREFLLEGPPE